MRRATGLVPYYAAALEPEGETTAAPSPYVSAAELAYTVGRRQLHPGNEVIPLRGGEQAFPAMLQAIASARESICFEIYILRSDRTGKRFQAALCERARAGVTVRVIYDAVGSFSLTREYLEEFIRAGVQLIEYHPIKPWKSRFAVNRRDHRKILVVDNEIGFTGGLNIADEYAPVSEGGDGWHDMHCQVRGPVVLDLARLFRRVWVSEGGLPYQLPKSTRPVTAAVGAGRVVARVLDNRKVSQRWKIRRAYLHAINRATTTVSLMNAYFLPDRGIRRALSRAARRGVRVRVVVPGMHDVPILGYAAEHIYGGLIRHGVEILMWPGRMMHAKTAVIDGVWSAIGSYNLDARSLFYNLEVLVEIVDRRFGSQMDAQFEADAGRCTPVSLSVWQTRPWWRKVLSWFFYRFRRWL